MQIQSLIQIKSWARRQSPPRLLTLGFFLVIMIGGFLLWLPISHNGLTSVRFIDALYVSTSCVCVTGLTTVPIGYTFNLFGRTIMAILIQIGGLGIASMGVLLSLVAGKRIGMKSRQLLLSGMNVSGYGGIIKILKIFLLYSLFFEVIGTILSFTVFIQDYPFWSAVGFSIFHSISAFNNAGFDILGGYDSLLMYAHNVPMNLITTFLVIVGGFGFIALWDLAHCRFQWRKLRLNTKVVTMMTILLLAGGTILLKVTTNQTWLEAWFQSVIARTAGFNTHPLTGFSPAGILIFTILMFIGANPGGTGGGIKTTTIFAVGLKAVSSTMNDNRDEVFHRRIPALIFTQALTVFFYGLTICLVATVLVLCFQPEMDLTSVMVDVVSAFATVGSTLGITPQLCTASKIVEMLCMFIGRLGPVTIATTLVFRGHNLARYTEENILIG